MNVFIPVKKMIEDDLSQKENAYDQYPCSELYEKVHG